MGQEVLGTPTGLLIVLLIALIAHEPFRWASIYIGRGLSADSEVFVWVRVVATALVAGLVTRLILFPAGDLEAVPLSVRVFSFVAGIGIFMFSGKNLGAGVVGGAALLLGLHYIIQ